VGDYTGAHTVIFRGIFSIYYSADGTSEAAMGGAWLGGGEGGHYIVRVPFQWKDIRPWRPEFGPEGNHFVSGG